MTEPRIEVLGVYKPFISDDVYQEQWQVTGSDEDTKSHFDQLVLIEAFAHNVGDSLKKELMGQQPSPIVDPKYFQCAYDEALLSDDGETLIQRRMNCVHGTGTLRFAFYLHLYDPESPLTTCYGDVTCPPIQAVPARLMMLVPYDACS